MAADLATIDLPYIERNKSRHQTVRYYFRFEGKRYARLPDNPDSQEFAVEYWKWRKIVEGDQAPASREATATARPGAPRPGTFWSLSIAYMKSEPYQRLDPTTRTKRRQIIDAMLLESVNPDNPSDGRTVADMPIAAMDVVNIEKLRDRKRETPFAADERLKVLRQIFETTKPGANGKRVRIAPINYALLVRPFRVKTEGHHTITDDEVASYVRHHGAHSKAVLAMVIMMFTGMRVSDLARIGPQHRRKDRLVFRVFKNRHRAPVTLEIEIHPILDMVLGWHKVTGMAYLMTQHGKPYSIKGLGNRVSEWFDQAGLPHCSAHSVRKGLATSLAESEATDAMLDSLFGWQDGKTSKIYTARKQQAKLARQAVQRINWDEIANILPHPEAGVPSSLPHLDKKAN